MPFFLDGNPTAGEVSEAVNYLLSNFSNSVTADNATGQIIGPNGEVQAYLYRYLQIKYADSFDGTVGFSNTPTNKGYYGLRNSDSSTESTNPVDYIWTQVTGGFGTTKLLYYIVTGGRQISLIAALAAPSALWQADSGSAIDLDVISGSDGASSRICYAKSTSTSLASTPTTYQTTGNASFPPYNTWGGAETWQATPPTLAVNEALFQSDGIYNPMTNLTTWNVPYLSNLKVGALSAITANMGTITAGTLTAGTVFAGALSAATGTFNGDVTVGSSPAISGTNMTGSGARIYATGNFAFGNSSKSVVFDGSNVYFNGMGTSAIASGSNVQMTALPGIYGDFNNGWIGGFTVSKDGYVSITISGFIYVSSNTTAYPGLYGVIVPAIYKYTGSGAGTLTANETQYILVTAPVIQPSFGLPVNRYQNVYVWTRNIYLTAGTYSGYLNSSFNFKDTAGVNQYAVPATDCLFSGYVNSLQPSV